MVARLAARYPNVSYGWTPAREDDVWVAFATRVRLAQDYLRYLDRRYDRAPKLRQRAKERTPLLVQWLVERLGCRVRPGRAVLRAALRAIERAVPIDPVLDAFFRSHRPDVVLLTPLIDLGSPQLDLLKSANAQALRTVLCVGSWDHLSSKALIWILPDLITVFKAVTLGSLGSLLALLYLWRFEGYSRSVRIIDWGRTFMAIGGSRVVARLLDGWVRGAAERGVPVLIIGAGDTGERVCRALRHGARPGCRVVGFLDDDAKKHGNRIHGCGVIGGRERLHDILRTHQIREVLVAVGDPPGALLEEVRRCCEPHGVTWQVVTAGIVNA
jgi:hypothetical protein